VEAAFLGFSGGKLRLHKVNGVVIEVPSEKMSTEDMRYIEKVTYKRASGTPNMSDDDIPLAQQRKQLNISRSTTPKKGPMIDWFEFFLSAGCDVDDCTRYASSFERDKIDEAILPDITDATMRSLGLREGDIIRVTKAIEQRHPKKPDASAQEQLLGDEAMARQLQEEERSGKKRTSPAPNLFAAGPGGALKQPRRGRPQSNKNGPASTVDLNAINTASDNIQRTSSPQALSPASTPVQAPPRSSSALAPVVSSGFDDEAWTPRPSSTKPLAPTPPVVTARAPSAPPVSAPPAAITVSPPAQPQNSGSSLAKTTESDIFDQLSRLSQLRPAASPAVSSTAFNHNSPPAASPPLASYHSGLGMGSSPIPIGQHVQNQQSGLLAPQQNGPRGPYAPVLANQSLLQPLIPTTSVLNSFVPTRPGAIQGQPQQSFISSQITGFPNSPQPMMQQPTGFPSMGPMLPQPTGMAGTNYSGFGTTPSFQNNGSFSGVQISGFSAKCKVVRDIDSAADPTGFNTGFGQSPFNRLASPPPVPPLPSSTSNNISPANIFAQMKSGTFASGNEHGPQPQGKYTLSNITRFS
jgi:actin cytoskeleton-regulatory complex protein SLA1